jgi:hypothetical protein
MRDVNQKLKRRKEGIHALRLAWEEKQKENSA